MSARSGRPASTPRSTASQQGAAPIWRRPRWLVGIGATLALVTVLAVAASSNSQATRAASHVSVAQPSAGAGGHQSQHLASFKLASIDGPAVGAPTAGPGLVYFTAGWCGRCVPEARALAQVHKQFGKRVNILAVSLDPSDSLSNLRAFRHQAGSPDYDFAWDSSGQLAQRLDVRALDTTLVYNAAGKIVSRGEAPWDVAQIRGALRKAGVR